MNDRGQLDSFQGALQVPGTVPQSSEMEVGVSRHHIYT